MTILAIGNKAFVNIGYGILLCIGDEEEVQRADAYELSMLVAKAIVHVKLPNISARTTPTAN